MKQQDIFALAVRLLGLLFLYHALQSAPMAVLGCIDGLVTTDFYRLLEGLAPIWSLIVARWLFRGAPAILRIAYPDGTAR